MTRAKARLALATAAAAIGQASAAHAAPPYPAITNRDFAIDLHTGVVFGSPRMMGMGGTATALAEGSSGMVGNTASVAMRPQSARDTWDWDANVDAYTPSLGSDFDNNGTPTTEALSVKVFDLGLVGLYEAWGVGISLETVSYRVTPEVAASGVTQVAAHRGRVVLGRALFDETVVAALGFRGGTLSIGRGDKELFQVAGDALEAGVILAPRGRAIRGGLRFSLPIHGSDVETTCDPANCNGYILPERVVAPWELGLGVAWRQGTSTWNHVRTGRFTDERAWTFAIDLVASGQVADGAGLEGFTQQQLQPSGRELVLSVRAGAEWELLPGRLRLRGGSYLEPPRLADAIPRLHFTAGLEVRLFRFVFWDAERRVALSLAGDVARRYGNVALAIAFWH